jgi:hypothetical protein
MLNLLSAERAISEFPFQRFAATGAHTGSAIPSARPHLPGFSGNTPTTPALQKRSSLLDPKERQEEDGKIVIDLLETRLV